MNTEPANTQSSLEHAFHLFNQGEYRMADRVCDTVLEQSETDTPSRLFHLKGKIAAQDQDSMKAMAWYKKALQMEPSDHACRQDFAHLLLHIADKALTQNRDEEARQLYRTALQINPMSDEAVQSLVKLEMKGENYLERLAQLHQLLSPKTYLEIGVSVGESLCRVQAETDAVAIDPQPAVNRPIAASCDFFNLTSDAFFQQHDLNEILKNRPLDMAFIDGLHVYVQVLKDFIHVERYANPNTVICIHDCLPLDPVTSNPNRISGFWTGDVWKLIPTLMHFRPDLEITMVPTAPSGLAIVRNANPHRYEEMANTYGQMVEQFNHLSFSDYEQSWSQRFNTIKNTWAEIASHLSAEPKPVDG
ncbi:class I SAM-dependent methyltransferase [Magnetococcus sp. PR-3]|uniref:class I SAM-dependent methyltransferase n=1 Tax=Magnetococcus sp. PR-3 TaxID=3120355 RepID=UPI002FCDF141